MLATGSVAFATMNGTAANATDQSLEQSEEAIIAELLSEFGFDTMEDLLGSTRTLPDVSHIKDLNDDGVANAADSQFILQFLNGQRMYYYNYSELDVTGDYIVNSADAQAYLQYYAYHRLYSPTVPFSGHGLLETRDNTYEYRTYVKHLYNGTSPDTTYVLNASSLLSAPSDFMSTQNSNCNTRSTNFDIDTTDTALIKSAGSGFIIGEHTIALAAHCIYNVNTISDPNDDEYVTCPLYAFIPTTSQFIELTPVAAHFPEAFRPTGNSDYDYAVVEVEEDLSSYGCFELGMILEGADQNEISDDPRITDGTGVALTVAGFPDVSNLKNKNGQLIHAGYSNGILDHFTQYNIYSTTSHRAGLSGGPLYTTLDKTVVGIHTSFNTYTEPVNEEVEFGMMITRPLLQFMYNNANLVYYEE